MQMTPKLLAQYPPADLMIGHIADLLRYDLAALLAAGKPHKTQSARRSQPGREKS